MADVVVLGAGGLGVEVAEAVQAAIDDGADFNLLGFLDDRDELQGTQIIGLPIVGKGDWIAGHPQVRVIPGIGHPRSRFRAVQRLTAIGATWETVVHPAAQFSRSATIGTGSVVLAGAIVSARVVMGDFTLLYYLASAAHDTVMQDFASAMPQAALSGSVTVGTGTFIGVHAAVRQGVRVGEWTILGAGAVAVKDVPPLCVAMGVPAAPRKTYDTPDEMPGI
ncbi:MAG: acetyltransferase [Armatimonadetes bacterium]|nr:acetyltransferase [Armatimonadota bacterium]